VKGRRQTHICAAVVAGVALAGAAAAFAQRRDAFVASLPEGEPQRLE